MDNVSNCIIVEVPETRFLSRMFSSEAEKLVQKLVGHSCNNSENQSINPLKLSQPLPQMAQLRAENMVQKLVGHLSDKSQNQSISLRKVSQPLQQVA
ncbi:MAG: hypothetical protein LKF31_07035, partial [Muribaculaceae bacterium]|nr:hypothetical protein [Muribaculaceae bacterium]